MTMNKGKVVHHDLHTDARDTLVIVSGKLYKLAPIEFTLAAVKAMPAHERPHVRYLNPIPHRTEVEQKKHNEDLKELHELSKQGDRPVKITSVRKAVQYGANIPEEIKKLLAQKADAKKKGDVKAQRLIRRQLRKLDYKRYQETQ